MTSKWSQNWLKRLPEWFQNGVHFLSESFGSSFSCLVVLFYFLFRFLLFSESFSNTVQRATRSGARPQNFAYESSCFRFVKRVEDSLTWNALPVHLLRPVTFSLFLALFFWPFFWSLFVSILALKMVLVGSHLGAMLELSCNLFVIFLGCEI